MRMALHNIWARRVSSFKVVLSMTIMLLILCIFVTYLIALEEKTQELVFGYRSGHYYSTETEEPLTDITHENIAKIKNINNISSFSVYKPVHNIFDLEFTILGNGDEEPLKCYHSEYRQGKIPPNATEMEIVFHRGEVGFYDNNTELITPNDRLEANYRWTNFSYIQAGTSILNDNEMLVSPEFLREYGLTNDIIGKTINITLQDEIYSPVKVVGVLSKKYYSLSGNVESPQILISKHSEIYAALEDKAQMFHVTELHITDYMKSRDVAQDLVTIAGISNFTTGSSYGLAMASTVTMVNKVLVGVMSTVGLGILIALLLNIIFSTQYMIKKKSNYYGMIRAYGATNNKVFRIMFCEIFVLSLVSIIMSYGLSYALAFILQAAFSNMLGIGVEFTPLNFGVTFLSAIVFSIVLLLIVTVINYVTAVRSNVMHLLRRSIDS